MGDWLLDMTAVPIVTPWTISGDEGYNATELQRAIIAGFTKPNEFSAARTFEKIFTFEEHGEFFRGIATVASLRYASDFYALLQQYRSLKVTIIKTEKKLE